MSENNMDYTGMNFDPMTGERLVPQTAEAETKTTETAYESQEMAYVQPAETANEPTATYAPVQGYEAVRENTAAQFTAPAREERREQSSRYFDAINAPEAPKAEMAGGGDDGPRKKPQDRRRKAKKERSGGGFFRKAAAAMALAVIFGAVAGGTFYGICRFTGVWTPGQTAGVPAITNEESSNVAKTSTTEVAEKADKEVKLVNSDNLQVITTDISDMVEEVIPAMVTIVNTGKNDTYDFWGRSYATQSSGTGVIIGENETELLIVTNHHVAKDSKQLDITFIDDTTVQAKVKGMDSDMDLAVLAVSLKDISAETKSKIAVAQLGDSDSLKLGQPAVVIGNALGIGISVTDGVISGLNREMTTEDGKTGTFIQTDAAVNHGNSGGALLNVKGEVIGIVSNKIDGESVEGMGYAIPISAANPIIQDLMERQTRLEVVEESEQGYLGVSLQNVTSEARAYYGLPEGAYVVEVVEGSGAQKAGLQKGDVITKLENENISSGSDAREILQYYRVGEEVTITYSRMEAGEYVSHEVKVTLGKRQD